MNKLLKLQKILHLSDIDTTIKFDIYLYGNNSFGQYIDISFFNNQKNEWDDAFDVINTSSFKSFNDLSESIIEKSIEIMENFNFSKYEISSMLEKEFNVDFVNQKNIGL